MRFFRFVHTADLHLGRRFAALGDHQGVGAMRARLESARSDRLGDIADVAEAHGAEHVLVAGDTFDTEAPPPQILRQALAVMGERPRLDWWLLPGHQGSLAAAGLWEDVRRHAPPNVHVTVRAEPLTVEPGVVLLPAPVVHRVAVADSTAWMASATTEPGALRIGLAHGDTAVRGLGGAIPIDRQDTARLDYLALGGRHGHAAIGTRTIDSGTPEHDSFACSGRGEVAVVTLGGPAPQVQRVEVGRFDWHTLDLRLGRGVDPAGELERRLPGPAAARRDILLRVTVSGRIGLGERARLTAAAALHGPEFCHFELVDTGTAVDTGDVDDFGRGPPFGIPPFFGGACPVVREWPASPM